MRIFTEERIVSLEEMIERNDVILVDTSFHNTRSQCVSSDCYEMTDYNSMDSALLNQENQDTLKFIEIMENQKSRTIPEVASELKRYVTILGEKIKFISDSDRNRFFNYRKKMHIKKGFMKAGRLREKNEKLLRKLQENAFCAYRLCNEKKLSFNDPAHNILTDMVKLIEEKMKLKKDTTYGYGQREIHDTSSDTDEKLSATLLYYCVCTDQKPALLTGDADFFALSSYASRILGSDIFLSYNEQFRKKINENQFRIYYSRDDIISEWSYDYISFFKTVSFRSLSDKEKVEFKEQLENLWKKYYQKTNQEITSHSLS